jgi:DNA-directed RNA polymerase subunit RPC12/RpoP
MALEDITLGEVACSECGKPIPAIPSWLATAKVKFQCEECRQRHPRVPGMADLETRRSIVEPEDFGETGDLVEEAAEEELDDELGEEGDEYPEE